MAKLLDAAENCLVLSILYIQLAWHDLNLNMVLSRKHRTTLRKHMRTNRQTDFMLPGWGVVLSTVLQLQCQHLALVLLKQHGWDLHLPGNTHNYKNIVVPVAVWLIHFLHSWTRHNFVSRNLVLKHPPKEAGDSLHIIIWFDSSYKCITWNLS